MAEENKWNNHINRLIDVMKEIPLHQITVLTGKNGSGKSFICKYLAQFIEPKVNDGRPRHHYVQECSMNKRIGYSSGLMRCCDCDMEDLPTSENTLHHIDFMFRNYKNCFLIIDELELGMSQEVQLGACFELNEKFKEELKNTLGILIITHSNIIVENIAHDNFINIEGMTADEWLNRKIEPYYPTDLYNNSRELSSAIEKRLKPHT